MKNMNALLNKIISMSNPPLALPGEGTGVRALCLGNGDYHVIPKIRKKYHGHIR